MKLLVVAGVVICASIALTGQDVISELKHIPAASPNGKGSILTARSIERSVGYPSIVELKGNAEIKTPVCLPVGKQGKLTCDGYMIVRADEVRFHEDTGEIEANGHVIVTPLRHKQ